MSSVSSTTSSTVSIPGLVSGIDYNSIINALVQAQQQPITNMQTRQQNDQGMISELQSFNLALSSLQNAAKTLGTLSEMQARSASVSDTTALTATAGSNAASGSYTLNLLQTAKGERIISEGFADTGTTAVASVAGSFKFQVGSSAAVTVGVTAGMTLQGLADAINASGGGVQASIINDGSLVNPYRLILQSQTTGSANTLQVLQNDTSLTAFNNLTAGSVGTAAGSQSNTFDGTVTSSGAYTGTTNKTYMVQITTGGAVGTAKFKVSEDGGMTWTANDAFTTSATPTGIYQTSYQGAQLAFGAGTKDFAAGDTFMVDAYYPTLNKPQDAVFDVNGLQFTKSSNTVTDAIPGVTLNLLSPPAGNTPVTINVSGDNQAITNNINTFVSAYNGVIRFIKNNASYNASTQTAGPLQGDATVNGVQMALGDFVSQQVAGLTGAYTSLSQIGITTQDDGAMTLDSSKLATALQQDPASVAKLFAGDGTAAGLQGIGKAMSSYLDGITNSSTGMISTRINNLNQDISNLGQEISDKQEQVTNYTNNLKAQFANLETIIAQSQSESSYLASQFNSLSNSGSSGSSGSKSNGG